MIIAVAGERFGHIFSMYEAIRKDTDWLIQIGSLGAFPDKLNRTKALRKVATPDDFQKIHSGAFQAPVPTLFIPGKHDDNKWLEHRTMLNEYEIAYNLSFIGNGNKALIGDASVIGLGKTFSPKTWSRGRQTPNDMNHYTRRDIERACANGPASILACYEPLYGTKFSKRTSIAEGLQKVIFAAQPKIVVHRSYDKTVKEYAFLTSTCYAIPAYEVVYFEYSNESFLRL